MVDSIARCWRTVGIALLAAILLLAAGCDSHLPSYRYRLTVEVQTPEGIRTGSSVIEVRTSEGAGFPGPEAGGMHSRVIGEAVAVDLGARGTLFALLRTSDGSSGSGAGDWAWVLLPPTPNRGVVTWDERVARYRTLADADGQAELPTNQLPLFVRFRDMADPLTLERVRPGSFQQKFGQGVRLRSVVVEITRDSVTREIADGLPWLDRLEDYRTDPDNPFTTNVPDEVHALRMNY